MKSARCSILYWGHDKWNTMYSDSAYNICTSWMFVMKCEWDFVVKDLLSIDTIFFLPFYIVLNCLRSNIFRNHFVFFFLIISTDAIRFSVDRHFILFRCRCCCIYSRSIDFDFFAHLIFIFVAYSSWTEFYTRTIEISEVVGNTIRILPLSTIFSPI